MAKACALDGSGTKPESPGNTSVPVDGRQPLKVGVVSSSRTVTILTQVMPAPLQSGLVAHSWTQMPSWQAPRSQSASLAQAAPGAPVPRACTHAGRIWLVGGAAPLT